MLRKLGMETVIAGNGKEAVWLGTTRRFDIIFMDINMPVYDGLEAARRIIAHEKKHSLPHTPIVALTAKAMKGDRESLYAAGIDGYCAKPIDMISLKKTVLTYARKPSPVKRSSRPESRAGTGVPSMLEIKKELGLEDHEISGIIREFFSSAQNYMKALDRAVSKSDFSAIMQAAHRMKGAAANMRLHRLRELCETVENAADRSEKFDYRDYAEKIKKEMGIAEKRLLKDY
jgi:CheY-like chemotaxis protein